MDILMHPDTLKQIDTLYHREAIQRAQAWRLGNRALGIQSSWIDKPRCWLMCQLGRFLVRVGRQLEHYGTPQTA